MARGMPRVSLSLPGKAREPKTYLLLVGGETIGLLSHASTVCQGSTSVARGVPRRSLSLPGKAREPETYILLVVG